MLTRKTAMIDSFHSPDDVLEKCPSSLDDVEIGDICVGYVSGVSRKGVFVKAIGNCSFFAPNRLLADGVLRFRLAEHRSGVLPMIAFECVQHNMYENRKVPWAADRNVVHATCTRGCDNRACEAGFIRILRSIVQLSSG